MVESHVQLLQHSLHTHQCSAVYPLVVVGWLTVWYTSCRSQLSSIVVSMNSSIRAALGERHMQGKTKMPDSSMLQVMVRRLHEEVHAVQVCLAACTAVSGQFTVDAAQLLLCWSTRNLASSECALTHTPACQT